MKRQLYAARGLRLDDVCAVDETGCVIFEGDSQQLALELHNQPVQVWTVDSQLLTNIAEAYVAAGHFDQLSVAMRGTGSSGVPAPLSIKCDKLPAAWQDPSATFPESDIAEMATHLGHGKQPLLAEGGELRAQWLRRVMVDWVELVRGELQTELSVTLASTAAKIGIPRKWRNAYRALAHRSDGWDFTRTAYYGGRVQCLQPGWTGEAVEYDLRSAYGWALTQPLPDWKIYDRRPLPCQPAWYDVTVYVNGQLGPLPLRDEEQPHKLHYPTDYIMRGVWTREDLERSGVGVKTVHRVLSGRWSKDLAPAVEQWLERREQVDVPLRALYRGLANSLAGKLCQKPSSWALWTSTQGEIPPAKAVPLSIHSRLWAVPVPVAFQPITCPQAGSYVTALVRSRVWPELNRQDAIYSDTDSIHLPASSAPPKNCGPAAGQWAPKVRGDAEYLGVRNYRIGDKSVKPLVSTQFGFGSSKTKRREVAPF